MNEWIGRAFRGGLAGAATIAALVLYSVTIAPRVEPVSDRPPIDYAHLDAAPYADVTPVGAPAASIAPDVFTGEAWELDSPRTLQTSHGTLFYREHRIEPTGELKISPLTLVFPVEEAGRVRNLLVRAPQGGRLRFTERIDLAAGKIGRIEGGQLLGPISMTMEPTTPDANDGFELRTRDVQIDRKLLSTPNEVDVRYGPHWAKGRDLAIAFREEGDEDESFGSHAALQHIASLELNHVDRVLVDLDAPGLFEDRKQPAVAVGPAPPAAESQGKLELRCKKDFTLDFDRRTATFEEDVELNRLAPEGVSDQIYCQRLEIGFGEAPSTKVGGKPKLVAERIHASGHPVMAHVRSRGLEAQAQSMAYDVLHRRLILIDDTLARLDHNGRRLESNKIEYTMAEGGGLGEGLLGPGRLQASMPGEPPQRIELFWNDRAQLRKQDGLHVISLEGGMRLVAGGASTASADEAHIWLEELPKQTTARQTNATTIPGGAPAVPNGAEPISAANFRPVKMLASGRVAVDSPRITVRTPQLEAWFQELVGVTPAAGGLGVDAFGAKGAIDPAAKRYELNGDLVRLQAVRRGEDWDLAELFIQGAVNFREIVPPQLSLGKPLSVTGEGLHWRRPPDADETLRIWGDPTRRLQAVVDSESMRLEGPAIDVNRSQSLIQVVGEGRMRLRGKAGSISPLAQVAGNPSAGGASGAATGQSEMQWVTVTWKESLSATGREATFRQDVKTTTDSQFAVSASLVARFDRPIDLMQTEMEAPKLDTLAFEGGIYSENRTVVSGELRSIDRFQADSLEIAPETGQFVARGPAWIGSVRLGTDGFATPAQAPPASGPKTLQYFYVECARGFEGDYLKRTVTFIDRTVALFAPAPSWDTQFRPGNAAVLPEKAVTMHCDRLKLMHVPAPGSGPIPTYYLEAIATGNARLETKGRNADAQRISFDESKDLITLEGDGRNDVHMETIADNGARSEFDARKVSYWRADNRVKIEDGSSAEYKAGADPRAPR